ncbi:hypothetical protein OIE62_35495 [Streptomyces scopuliridis]|uniref:Uncharacterized protein n=1 Tax=Streptomyces scopuliridis TaxID=452529 RepID=A0ACD4ZE55_9ACTN|nr:hypothetical protein [Streptomyces scopuliridis]WSB32233.1 hypothetical protein OG949_04735 [Streptomyces scopuliridis]WSB96493.1 hypothetical protein OG835_05435 [Streptomyces scopuliridis]WSC09803.1 hypothetical protein OIE62_35495 [Streptomyces scopuliridis]
MPLDPTPSDDAPIRTLLWTAATARPLDEVRQLVALRFGADAPPENGRYGQRRLIPPVMP